MPWTALGEMTQMGSVSICVAEQLKKLHMRVTVTVFTVLALHLANATQIETDPISVISHKAPKVRIVSAIVTVTCIFTENFNNVNTC